jgi:hypothetical protein
MSRQKKEFLGASRKLRRKKFFIKTVLVVFVFAAAVFGFFNIKALKIQKIIIQGNITLGKEDLSKSVFEFLDGKQVKVLPKDNILFFSKDGVENYLLSNFLRIKQVSIDRDLPNTLLVKIQERNSTVLFCESEDDKKCAFVDEDGFVFEKAPFFSGNIFVKFFDERQLGTTQSNLAQIPFQLTETEKFKNLIGFMDFLEREGGKIKDTDVLKIVLKDEGLYEIHAEEGWCLLLKDGETFDTAKENFVLVYENKLKDYLNSLEYVDLRLENKVFYKFKNG